MAGSSSSFFVPDTAPHSLKRWVSYLEKTEARDKIVKSIQNFLKYLVWRYAGQGQKDLSKRMKVLASALSEYRSILKFGKPLKCWMEIRDIGTPADLADTIDVTSNCFDIVYKLYDNIEFLSKYKVLGYDPDRMESISKVAQFWCYLGSFLLNAVEWRNLRTTDKDEKRELKMQKLRLDLVKNTSDLLRVLPPFLRRFSSFPTHDGFSGLMGTIAGAAGAYAVWLKTK